MRGAARPSPKPGVSEDDVLPSDVSDREKHPFRVILEPEYKVHDFGDGSVFVWRSVDVEDRNRSGQLAPGETMGISEARMHEDSGGSAVHQGLQGASVLCIRALHFNGYI